jgi:hypothetical protein
MKMNKIQKTVTLLSREEAKSVYDRVMSLQDEWILRIPAALPFYTIGVGTVPDKMDGSAVYVDRLEATNKILRENFSELYDKVLDFFNKELGPTRYDPGRALPMFMIFSNKDEDKKEIVNVPDINYQFKIHHDDIHQYQEDYFGHDYLEHITFTLSISTPKRGAGLFVYGEDFVDGACDEDDQVFIDIASTPHDGGEVNIPILASHDWDKPKFIKYYPGSMVYQIGEIYHQAIIGLDVTSHDDRITLQGVGVKKDGEWLLYY